MRDVLYIFMILLFGWQSAAAQKVNEAEAISKINAAASAIKSMECDFEQTKDIKMLNDKMVSRGKMYYQQSDKLRWEYTSPYVYTFVINGSKVLLKKGQRSDVIDVNQSKLFKEIARIMMNSVLGRSISDSKNFKSSISATSAEYVVTLLPQRREMKQMFQKIVLHFSKSASMVSTVELIEKKGDKTTIKLKNVKKNKSTNAQLFTVS